MKEELQDLAGSYRGLVMNGNNIISFFNRYYAYKRNMKKAGFAPAASLMRPTPPLFAGHRLPR
jgi:hypothetical protein